MSCALSLRVMLLRQEIVKVRNQGGSPDVAMNVRKQIIPVLTVAAIGLAVALFIAGNIFQAVFVVKSGNGVVQSDITSIKAPVAGVFTSLLDPEAVSVTTGQKIATLRVYEAGMAGVAPAPAPSEAPIVVTQQGTDAAPAVSVRAPAPVPVSKNTSGYQEITIESPCDCYIAESLAKTGEFRAIGDAMFTLIPVNQDPWIAVTMPLADVHRIETDGKALAQIAGSDKPLPGKVLSVKTSLESFDPGVIQPAIPTATIKIKPDAKISHDMIGRPVSVDFLLY
jgi:hypothetical protein